MNADPLGWDHLLHARHCSKYFNCHNHLLHEVATNIPLSGMEKLRHKKVKQLALCPENSRAGMGTLAVRPQRASSHPPCSPSFPATSDFSMSVFSFVRGLPVIPASQGANEIMCEKAFGKLQHAL